MKFLSKIAASIGVTLALAAVSFAQHVKTDYDHSANFGQYKTYSWEKIQTKDPLLVDRIKAAVNSGSGDLAMQPQRSKPTKWGPW